MKIKPENIENENEEIFVIDSKKEEEDEKNVKDLKINKMDLIRINDNL